MKSLRKNLKMIFKKNKQTRDLGLRPGGACAYRGTPLALTAGHQCRGLECLGEHRVVLVFRMRCLFSPKIVWAVF